VTENLWHFMHETWLSNRVFIDDDEIVGHRCFYVSRLIEMLWHIMPIGLRGRAHRF